MWHFIMKLCKDNPESEAFIFCEHVLSSVTQTLSMVLIHSGIASYDTNQKFSFNQKRCKRTINTSSAY